MSRVSPVGLAGGVLAGFALLWTASTTRAAGTERVKFESVDQVELHGTFYSSDKGKRAPCAILLHAIGEDSQKEGWDALAKKLQAAGFAVLTFDFRGHGESTNVGPLFWTDPRWGAVNRGLKGARTNKQQISIKDYGTLSQYATLVNDIAAAKRFLDRKNDSEECNSANTAIIGAEGGANLGVFWIYTEWQRSRIQTGFPVVTTNTGQKEGQDIAAAVCISMTTTLTGRHTLKVDGYLSGQVKDKVPMFFVYGEQDTRAAQYAKHLYSQVLHADRDKKLHLTIEKAIKDTKLAGRELLGKSSLQTEELITKYVSKIAEDRAGNVWAKKDVDKTMAYPVPVGRFLR